MNNSKNKKNNNIKPSNKSSNNDQKNNKITDLVLINSYKTAMNKAQIEAIIDILIKNKITTYEEIWKKTNEIFNEMSKDIKNK
ncbi:MAG: hypothetical protein KatS3mg002_0669 [Candidatus Woesearchaeota archaeon]|nr:MAG: hypothetical protein KatS3mg002_0669 [Candidatus Woesearchaeota archaeon]